MVDDGADRGSTLIVTARWIRKQHPRYLIIAVPVANPANLDGLKREADRLVVVTVPSRFGTINQFYQDFKSVTDREVIDIMQRRGRI